MRCAPNVRLFLLIAVLFAWVSSPLHRLTAQEAALPTAELLKRLGEAVDGYRSGGQVYVVATTRAPYVVFGVFETRTKADSALRAAAGKPGLPSLFGPYTALTDAGHPRAFVVDSCGHLYSSRLDCPGTSAIGALPLQFVRASDIDSVVVTIRLRTGATRRIVYGADVDALFFSPAAIDKFVIPYYVRIMGVDSAAALRRAMLARLP